jgi:hypothetical protein
MRHFFSIFTRAVAALLLVAGVASAGTITLSTPTGLNPGDKFRFLAVTSGTTTATTTSINTYNTFVQTDLGDAVYNGGVVNWKAIGSTSVVDARDNVGGFGSLVPVYKPFTGTKIANDLTTNAGGLWTSSLFAAPNETLSGTIPGSNTRAWTGTQPDGTKFPTYELGDSDSMYGVVSVSANQGWIRATVQVSTNSYRMYGLSEELTVPSAVPEIDPAGMGSVMALVTGALGLLERRRLSCLRS